MQIYLNFYRLLGAFANWRRANIEFVMFVCPSVVLTHGTNRLPIDRFLKINNSVFFEIMLIIFKIENIPLCFNIPNKTTSLFCQEHNNSI